MYGLIFEDFKLFVLGCGCVPGDACAKILSIYDRKLKEFPAQRPDSDKVLMDVLSYRPSEEIDLAAVELHRFKQGIDTEGASVEEVRRQVQQRAREEKEKAAAREKLERDAAPIFAASDLDAVEPRFRFREPGERNIGAAEAELMKYRRFPIQYFRLLVSLRGAAQQGTDATIVFVHGASGAGKNATIRLAADVLGCELVEGRFTKDRDAVLAAYATAAESRAFMVVNEVQDVHSEHLKVIPHLAEGTTYWRPYAKVQSRVEQNAVVVLTARTMPMGLLADPALARRIIFVDLGQGAAGEDWLAVGNVEGWRRRNPDFADDLVSRELDQFRDGKSPTARQVAATLGYGPLAEQMERVLRDFANRLERPSKHSPYSGEDWRTIPRGARGHAAAELWKEFDKLRPLLDSHCELRYASGRTRTVFIKFPFLSGQGSGDCAREHQRVPSAQVQSGQGAAFDFTE